MADRNKPEFDRIDEITVKLKDSGFWFRAADGRSSGT
jgi:hypothetical protein